MVLRSAPAKSENEAPGAVPVGQRFGSLTVIGAAEGRMWLCRCDCGTEKPVDRYKLLTGHTKSCGCSRRASHTAADYAGRRFGRLVVLREEEASASGHRKWLCRCDCGNEIAVLQTSLNKGATSSCGCHRRQVGRQRMENNAFCMYKGSNISRLRSIAPGANNTSGAVGVCRDSRSRTKERWIARIGIQGRTVYLGSFPTFEEAVKARQAAEETYHRPLIEEYLEEHRHSRGQAPAAGPGKEAGKDTVWSEEN